jgi:prevent-host-death family protein
MTEVSVAELRSHLPRWLERAAAGEAIVITRRGKPLARLSPVEDKREEARRFFDELRPATELGDVVSPVGEDWEAERGHL